MRRPGLSTSLPFQHPSSGGVVPPSPPVATAATNKTDVSFSANWDASVGATKYYLDVSTSAVFATFVPGFNSKDVGNVTTYSVTGLAGNTTYYYRVRSYNGATSGNSNVINVTTFCVLAQAYFTFASITDTAQKNNYNQLFLDISDGTTSHYDNFHLAGNYSGKAIYSLFGGITATPVGSPAYTPGSGVIFNGSNYINSGWIPSAGSNWKLNDAGIGWLRIGVSPTNYFLTTSPTPEHITVGYRGANNLLYCGINNSAAPSIDVGAKPLSVFVYRNDDTTVHVNFDASSDSAASASQMVDTGEVQYGAENNMPFAQNGTGFSHVYSGDSTLDKDVIDAAIAAFYSRM